MFKFFRKKTELPKVSEVPDLPESIPGSEVKATLTEQKAQEDPRVLVQEKPEEESGTVAGERFLAEDVVAGLSVVSDSEAQGSAEGLADDSNATTELSEAESKDSGEGEGESAGGFLARLRRKLSATREHLAGRIEKVLSTVREIDEDVLEELEEVLITADLGVKTTQDLLFVIRGQVARRELKDAAALKKALRRRLVEMMTVPFCEQPKVSPLVILLVGVNGVGKTTTIAKLAKHYREEGRTVLLAAGDTFRAAAVEQLGVWARRLSVDLVSQPTGADPSAVVYDALSAAKARKTDVVIIDTAGRLHTRVNLMDELKKIKRVAGKAMPGAPHETILVLDATTGQNAASQARSFHEAIGVDALIVTKLDGTSKGGVVVSITNELKLPVIYIGLGETFDDLRPFEPEAFAEAVLGSD